MQLGNSIYLDYQATTPVDPRVKEEMAAYDDVFANPHSVGHFLGQQAAMAVDTAKADVESYIGAAMDEVIFTSGATEANNQAIASVLFANKTARTKILVGALEHKCIKNAATYFATYLGYSVEEVPVLPSGLIDLEAYKNMLSEDVLLVCIMAVNNEIGTIQDIKQLSELAHEYGALFHCDAAQAPEATNIDVRDWDVDMLSLSAHKAYGPKGIGALYIKNSLQVQLPPLIHGGGQQFGLRSGTLPTGLCVGFAKALTISKEELAQTRQRLLSLKQRFIENLSKSDAEFLINGDSIRRHPGNINLQFVGRNATSLLSSLQPEISASTGSACNSEMILASHVLKAIGLSDEQAKSSLRFSLGRFTDDKQVDKATEIIRLKLQASL